MISQSVVCIYMHVVNVFVWVCCCAVVIHMQWLYIVLEHSRWSLIDRLDDVYSDIADIVYLLDVLVVVVHISHSNCWSTYYCTRIEVSVLRAGRRRGGGWKFFSPTKFCFFKNVPGVLKRMHNFFFRGGILGCLGRPTPPPGVARGRKMIHFFLWPWHVTG